MSQLTIREISVDEIDEFLELSNITKKGLKIQQEILFLKNKLFAAMLNESIVGGMSLEFSSHDNSKTIPNQRIYLSHLFVNEQYRNRGYASLLIDFAIDYANKIGIKEISISVSNNNIIAKRLYLHKGFSNILAEYKEGQLLLLNIPS